MRWTAPCGFGVLSIFLLIVCGGAWLFRFEMERREGRGGAVGAELAQEASGGVEASEGFDGPVGSAGVGDELVFSRFAGWAQRYVGRAGPEERELLESEGLGWARQRRDRMERLIRRDPAAALGVAVSEEIRRQLPDSVRRLVEERVDVRGDLSVVCALEGGGGGHLARTALVEGREYEVFTHGRRLGVPSRRSIPMHGIAVGDLLALSENPYRRLSAAESAGGAAGRRCLVGGEVLGEDGVLLAVGGEVHAVCEGAHLAAYVEGLAGEEAEPSTGAGGGGSVGSRTEGMKRLVLIRVDFPDLTGDPLTGERGAELIGELDGFFQENSYGRSGFHLAGQGSVVTETLRMPETAAYYGNNNRYNELRADARSVAAGAGYTLSEYDYDVTCMAEVPGFTWRGLGFVGSVGAWMRGSFESGIAAHELGHNFGLNHANSWDTGGGSVIGENGSSLEYGDTFDTMGLAEAGARHFNTRYKELLGWIKADEVETVQVSGTYRIFAQDDASTTGLRALRIPKDGSRNYWVEFRQALVENKWLMNGVGLRWGGGGNQGSDLLDTSPGSPGEIDDSALLIGRTFSDRSAGIHITPIRRGGTTPESLDVVVQLGDFSANLLPEVGIGTSTLAPSRGQVVEFSALATDSDGDELAYYWDFGDGSFGGNRSVVTHAWALSGEYVVRCEVTDLKGGKASDSLVIRAGTPSTFRISGRVFADGLPLEGVRVYASSTQQAYTDSDGSYDLVGLPAGGYTLNAHEVGYTFTPATFFNPVEVGGGVNALGVDFVGGDPANRNTVKLVSGGELWRYLDDGSELSDDWVGTDYDDGLWGVGRGEFGYGDGDEVTLLGYGPDEGNKRVTTYFRKKFVVNSPRDFSGLDVGLLRDDGAVVYLNGREVWRSNMPVGVGVLADTLALEAVTGLDETLFENWGLPADLLVPGTNLLAVEVHQAAVDSSDISFLMTVTGLIASNSLVAAGSLWRYLDDGSSQLTEWLEADYDDSDWGIGAGVLGYGDPDVETVISYGPDLDNKYITTYFRRLFTVSPETQVGNMTLGLLRDDGAVVYLNGREIFRSNMPGGAIHAAVPAASVVGGKSEETFYHEATIDPALLVPGPNLLAVEVHQHKPTSSDVRFDCYLTAFGTLNSSRNVYIQDPANTTRFDLPTDLPVRIQANAGYGRVVSEVLLYAGAKLLARMDGPPYAYTWTNPPSGTHELKVVARDDVGEALVSPSVSVTVSLPVSQIALVPLSSEWRYLDDGTDQGADWVGVDFDDSGWPTGLARFGYGGDDEVTVIDFGPDVNDRRITTYFRRDFELPGGFELTELIVQLQRDDGAVVYWNGQEVFRSNILPGPVLFSTLAYAGAGGSDEHKLFTTTIPAAGIVRAGRNVVAVEVHQNSPASTDLGFDLQLVGVGVGEVADPRLRMARLGPRLALSWPSLSFGWVLQSSPAPGPGAEWATVTSPLLSTNGENVVLVVPSREQQFFRLVK